MFNDGLGESAISTHRYWTPEVSILVSNSLTLQHFGRRNPEVLRGCSST